MPLTASPLTREAFAPFGQVLMAVGDDAQRQEFAASLKNYRAQATLNMAFDARVLILDFSNIPGVEVWQIGNEGGFLAAPVNLTAVNGNKILMGGAERADVIVDFTNVAVGNYVLGNVGPDAPSTGLPVDLTEVADPNSTGQVMQFRVGPALTPDPTTPPQFLALPAIVPLIGGTARPVALLEELSGFFVDAPAELRLGTVAGDPNTGTGTWTGQKWMDPVTENPAVGATEVWDFYSGTVDAHPMHIHEVLFQVVNRQAIFVDESNKTFQVVPGSVPTPPEPLEDGCLRAHRLPTWSARCWRNSPSFPPAR